MTAIDFKRGVESGTIASGQVFSGTWGDEDVIVIRNEGNLCALAAKCTHADAPLAQGLVVNGEIRCPWHHARFSLATGEAVAAPAFASLKRFTVVEADGIVRITGAVDEADAKPEAPSIGRVVIVGAGAAGYACAEMLARNGAGGSVMVLSDDADEPYDRTTCSKEYLQGAMDRTEIMLPRPGSGSDEILEPTLRTGVSVERIDIERKTVVTSGGEIISYDTLVLATGATPIMPAFEGNDRDNVHLVRTLADADALIVAMQTAKAAIVLGSSYIGLEVAASLIQRGLSVSIIAEDHIPLEKTTGPEIGAMIRKLHEEKGVSFYMGRQIRRWDGMTASLDDGTTVVGDILVVGTGVKPRIEIASAAGLALAGDDAGGGIMVNAQLRTSANDIYAIGDIASAPDQRLGHSIRVEHWVVAQRMGQWLARYLLGQEHGSYNDVPFFWSGHYETSLRYVGHVESPDDRRINGDVANKDVAVTFKERGEAQALLTCGRDEQSLKTEAEWGN